MASQAAGPRKFYFVTKKGGHSVVRQTIGGEEMVPIVLDTNTFEALNWQDVRKPIMYDGTWPPMSVENLLDTPAKEEECGECKTKTKCECDYTSFVAEMKNFYTNNICIRLAARTGYGIFARAAIPAPFLIGEYTGELIPYDKGKPDEETEYVALINIGKWRRVKGRLIPRHPECWIDAARGGSVFRFLNHSCSANTEFVKGRIGMSRRALFIVTTKPIKKDEEITLDYGEDYFRSGQFCRCGRKECRYPQKPHGEKVVEEAENDDDDEDEPEDDIDDEMDLDEDQD